MDPELKVFQQDESLHIGGVGKANREEFYRILRSRALIVTGNEFKNLHGEDGYAAFTFFEATLRVTNQGKRLSDIQIVVNRDDYYIDGEDYTDLIPITLEHEITELWLDAKPGYSLNPPPSNMVLNWVHMYRHTLATRREWEYAVEQGKGDRYLQFLKKYVQKHDIPHIDEFIHECEYSLARATQKVNRKI